MKHEDFAPFWPRLYIYCMYGLGGGNIVFLFFLAYKFQKMYILV